LDQGSPGIGETAVDRKPERPVQGPNGTTPWSAEFHWSRRERIVSVRLVVRLGATGADNSKHFANSVKRV
jgi:hypothetical protein